MEFADLIFFSNLKPLFPECLARGILGSLQRFQLDDVIPVRIMLPAMLFLFPVFNVII